MGDERGKMLLQLGAAAGRALYLTFFVLFQRHDDQGFFPAIQTGVIIHRHGRLARKVILLLLILDPVVLFGLTPGCNDLGHLFETCGGSAAAQFSCVSPMEIWSVVPKFKR